MRIAIIGAGIVGVTSAYELAAQGHEVTVFERHGSVASDASFAHGGLLHPGWPSALQAAGSKLAQPAWHWSAWRARRHKAHAEHQLQAQRLALLSQARLQHWRQELRLDYERADGVLLLLRTARELKAAQAAAPALETLGIRHEWLDGSQCLRVEPGLCPDTALQGGLYLPQAEVGNGRQFAHLLKAEAQRLGVRFRFHTTVRRIDAGGTPGLLHEYTPPAQGTSSIARADEARADSGPDTVPMPMEPQQERFDAIVVCAAMGADALLRPLGLKLPMATLHGHSITASLRQFEAHPDLGPRAGLLDLAQRTSLSRQGLRVRVAGAMAMGAAPARAPASTMADLHKVLHDWFPGAAHLASVQAWSGSVPLLPDGLPLLGESGQAGIWLNLGHGTSGWTLACGSAQALAERIAGRAAPTEISGLGLLRLG